jgi:hypothetical protein
MFVPLRDSQKIVVIETTINELLDDGWKTFRSRDVAAHASEGYITSQDVTRHLIFDPRFLRVNESNNIVWGLA